MRRNKYFGNKGEDIAELYLKKNGYKILEKQFKCYAGEADIIAEKDNWLIFAEVKTRSNLNYGLPSEAVDYKKQKKYIKIAEYYLSVNTCYEKFVRFDVIEILGEEINHLKAVYFKN